MPRRRLRQLHLSRLKDGAKAAVDATEAAAFVRGAAMIIEMEA